MNTALIVVDVQNDYFPEGKMELVNSTDAGENIKRIIERFRQTNKTIIHIQHLAIRPNASFFIPGTPGAEINQCAQPLAGEPVLVKNYPNSFRGTALDQILKEQKIDQLVIVGMMTHMCIDTTTRAAFDLGYNCIVIGDCCATRNLSYNHKQIDAPDVHNAFLASLNGTFAAVLSCDEYLNQL